MCFLYFSNLLPTILQIFSQNNRKNNQERSEVRKFLFELIDNNYIFPSIAEIAKREIEMLKTDKLYR